MNMKNDQTTTQPHLPGLQPELRVDWIEVANRIPPPLGYVGPDEMPCDDDYLGRSLLLEGLFLRDLLSRPAGVETHP